MEEVMTTLVTGGTGLIGGHIVRELEKAGEKVRLLVRGRSSFAALEGVAFEVARGDVREPESLQAAMRGVDQVVHAAASVRTDPFDDERVRRVNVEGTRNVLAAAQRARVRRLLHVSSIAAVATGTLDRPADETSAWDLAGRGAYWQTKRESELLVLEAARAGGLEAVVVNPSYAIGPGDVKPSSGGLLLLVATGRFFAYPDGGSGFVDARDVAKGALAALSRGRTGERYILSSENLTWREFLTRCAEAAHEAPPRVPVPRALALGAARFGDALGGFFPRAFPSFNRQAIASLYELNYVSHEKARRELGFAPQPVREAIADAYAWFRETGRLPGGE
jgi:dihydroflavonol-4-reductase